MRNDFELAPSDLRCVCDPAVFDFTSTADIDPLDEVIGQKRAVQAIDFGLNMNSPGYNIFVTGLEGTGKTTIVKDIVEKHAASLPVPQDWCMVNNFADNYRPKALSLPPGKALRFSKQMQQLIQSLKRKLPDAFSSESFQESRSRLKEKYQKQEKERFQTLEQSAKEKSLAINRTESGYQTVPLVNEQPITREIFEKLTQEEKAAIEEKMHSLQSEIEAALRDIAALRQEMSKEVEKLVADIARFVVQERMAFLKDAYKDMPDVLTYLEAVQNDIVENVADFTSASSGTAKSEHPLEPPPERALRKYAVNVLVDRSQLQGAPVVFEPNPTYFNVFGRIDKQAHMSGVSTDFTMVQAGSLLQANGGFLIMEIEALLLNPFVWEALKRALLNKQLFIEDLAPGQGFITASLRPEPIPLKVKVILLGGYQLFAVLQNHDSKFNKIFKVRADFDYEVVRNEKTVQQYARFVARVCRQEQLLPFTPEGVAAIVEFGEKDTANKNKLSLRFGPIVGIIKEADYWAHQENAEVVTDRHVIKAFNEYRFRYNLYEEKIHESYVDNTILVDVESTVIGQVNALSVYHIGDISFGRPSRITAETYMGEKGIVNIEREAKLSGKTHDKGVLILAGFLGRTFAQHQPLALNISLTFEQSYGGIDGDSASSSELYAILSSLAGCPIDQGIAVTGSVNQKGAIQAIGGVNHKIEGFFDVCKAKGLNGRQGVMIPVANIKNLMLKKEVVDAVTAGRFHIYGVSTVEDGIQILTQQAIGEPDDAGRYPEASLFGRIQKQLRTYLDQAIRFKQRPE